MENKIKPKSPEALQLEDWFLEKISQEGHASGTLVQTKFGPGYTKNEDSAVYGKVPVYLNDGRKILCSMENITVIGFYD